MDKVASGFYTTFTKQGKKGMNRKIKKVVGGGAFLLIAGLLPFTCILPLLGYGPGFCGGVGRDGTDGDGHRRMGPLDPAAGMRMRG